MKARTTTSHSTILETALAAGAAALTIAFFTAAPIVARQRPAGAIDWASIRQEHAAKASIAPEAAPFGTASLAIGVDRTGIVRAGYEDMLAAGFDAGAASHSQLALLRAGVATPIRVVLGSGKGAMGPGGFVEFLGEAASSLSTRTNVYQLTFDNRRAARVKEDSQPATGATTVIGWQTLKLENDRDWSSASPNGDPWFDEMILAYTSPQTLVRNFTIDDVQSSYASTLKVDLWGVTNWPAADDHHVRLAINGTVIGDDRFDGLTARALTFNTSGLLRNGQNSFEMTVVGDTGQAWDMIAFDGLEIQYGRTLRALDGAIDFLAEGTAIQVGDLGSGEIVAYSRTGNRSVPTLLSGLVSTASKVGNDVVLPGSSRGANYSVARADRLIRPTLRPWTPPVSVGQGAAWLAISHPDFVADLQPLVKRRSASGLSTAVVTTDAIYSRYSGGNVDPQAIRQFLRDARQFGTQYVLLAGGDTLDPLDNLRLGAMSFVPTLYVKTGPTVNFAPSDASLADVDQDGLPDLAIGRLPARTSADLRTMVAKTLAFDATSRPFEAVFVADQGWGFMSMLYAGVLNSSWSVTEVRFDEIGGTQMPSAVSSALAEGPALTHYLGHSVPEGWGQPVFLAANALQLDPNAAPTALLQSGCWSTFVLDPRINTLTDNLMRGAGTGGAAVVIGPSALVSSDTMGQLDELLLQRMNSGSPMGRALLEAKRQMAQYTPNAADAYLGVNYLGDPAVKLP